MTIKVLFFGATADVVGTRICEVQTNGTTATALIDQMIREYPELSRHKLLFSLNEEYLEGDVPLDPGDELAIFTAVSGG